MACENLKSVGLRRVVGVCFLLVCGTLVGTATAAPPTSDSPLRGKAAELYRQAMETGRFAKEAATLKPVLRPTTGDRSFFVVWKPAEPPTHWIVSLHGAGRPARGFATDDFAVWYPHLNGRRIGLVCLQWWLGTGDDPRDFLTPTEMYREIDVVLQELKVEPQRVMLHGFSRGSTNTFAVAALDHGRGRNYFSLIAASSGGVALDYGPIRALLRGEFGDDPLRGTRWVTAAGVRDPNAERDGIPGMRRTADWLKQQGAVVVASIEDPTFGHGALHLNSQNMSRLLDLFVK